MKKGFASIIILLVIAFIILITGVMIYQKVLAPKVNTTPTPTASPTPDTTAGWRGYTNETDDYTLKYPTSWNVKEETVTPGFRLLLTNQTNTQEIGIDSYINPFGCEPEPGEPTLIIRRHQVYIGNTLTEITNFCGGDSYFINMKNKKDKDLQLILTLKEYQLDKDTEKILQSLKGLVLAP